MNRGLHIGFSDAYPEDIEYALDYIAAERSIAGIFPFYIFTELEMARPSRQKKWMRLLKDIAADMDNKFAAEW